MSAAVVPPTLVKPVTPPPVAALKNTLKSTANSTELKSTTQKRTTQKPTTPKSPSDTTSSTISREELRKMLNKTQTRNNFLEQQVTSMTYQVLQSRDQQHRPPHTWMMLFTGAVVGAVLSFILQGVLD